jgi:hypothetical protein
MEPEDLPLAVQGREEVPIEWRKPPQELMDLFRNVMPGPPAVERKMLMGRLQDDRILRLLESHREEFIKLDGAKIFEPMPGRPMREYVAVPPRAMARQKELVSWVSRALDCGASLKPKSRPNRPKKAGTQAKRSSPSKKNKRGNTSGLVAANRARHRNRKRRPLTMSDIKHSI